MVAIATETFATSMQPCPSQLHLSRGTHLLIKTVSIRPSHIESRTGLPIFIFILFYFFFIRTLQKKNKISIDSKMSSHRLFFCFKENSFSGDSIIFPPHWNLPRPHQKYMQFQYRPWSSSLNGIKASTELFIKNFFL